MTPVSSSSPFPTVAFIGLGLIGGSLARLLRHQLPETTITVLDESPATQQLALSENIANTLLSGLDDPKLQEADLIVLGTHLERSCQILEALGNLPAQRLNVMDLSSTKATICQTAERLPEHIRFIGGHPLAGREVSGFSNSRWELFHQKRFLLTPCAKTDDTLQSNVSAWLAALGILPVTMETDEHDQLMSMVSHFPQFYAVALANLLARNNPDKAMHFLGGGIDDQMRLMASPHTMWGDILKDNKSNILEVLDHFTEILSDMRTALEQDSLHEWFDNSHRIYHQYQDNKRNTTEAATP